MKDLIKSFLLKNKSLNILVVGDVMVDQYLWGKMERISPEAPVPIVDIAARERRLGGAANAALNLIALGARCSLCGIVGQDEAGNALRNLAKESSLDTSFLFPIQDRKTTLKTRIICAGQQVLRVDEEVRTAIPGELEAEIWNKLEARLQEFDGILFSDYDKGFLSSSLIQAIIQRANELGISSMVDPKFKNFWQYRGCSLFKPNLKELNEGLGHQLAKDDFRGIENAIEELRTQMPHQHTLITLSEQGMLLLSQDGQVAHLAAHRREIIDVSGAGDAVMAVAGLALAGGFSVLEAARLANIAGGLVCEEIGVTPIRPERLLGSL